MSDLISPPIQFLVSHRFRLSRSGTFNAFDGNVVGIQSGLLFDQFHTGHAFRQIGRVMQTPMFQNVLCFGFVQQRQTPDFFIRILQSRLRQIFVIFDKVFNGFSFEQITFGTENALDAIFRNIHGKYQIEFNAAAFQFQWFDFQTGQGAFSQISILKIEQHIV